MYTLRVTTPEKTKVSHARCFNSGHFGDIVQQLLKTGADAEKRQHYVSYLDSRVTYPSDENEVLVTIFKDDKLLRQKSDEWTALDGVLRTCRQQEEALYGVSRE